MYYKESLLSSNLNSKQLRFHGVRPNVETKERKDSTVIVETHDSSVPASPNNSNNRFFLLLLGEPRLREADLPTTSGFDRV